MFTTLLTSLLDLIFPPKDLEKEIRTMRAEDLATLLSPQERNGVRILFSYKKPIVRHMIWRLKYKHDQHVASLFGEMVHEYVLEYCAERKMFNESRLCIIPLPLTKKRERERGYNQIHVVTDVLESYGHYEIRKDILKKVRHTKPQTEIRKKEERRNNVRGVFATTERVSEFLNTPIIILDDVVTTGSTLHEARKTLTAAGVKNVWCLALSG